MSDDRKWSDRDRSPIRRSPSPRGGGDRGDRGGERGGRRGGFNPERNARRVFCTNIPWECTWQKLKDIFKTELGEEITYVEFFKDENDRPRGSAIVEFKNSSAIPRAVDKMNKFDVDGRQIIVKSDFENEREYRTVMRIKERKKEMASSGGHHGGGGGGGGGGGSGGYKSSPQGGGSAKFGNTYGLSVQFLESLGIDGPLQTKVFVGNLDYKVDVSKFREVFKLAGRVISAELTLDQEGKSRGFGFIEYDHPVEAVQAVSMLNGQQLYERKMNVKIDMLSERTGKLPEGLKAVGMGLGSGGAPLKDVARNLPQQSSNSSSGGGGGGVSDGFSNGLSTAALAASLRGADSLAGLGGLGLAAALGLGRPSMDPLASLAAARLGVERELAAVSPYADLAGAALGSSRYSDPPRAVAPSRDSGDSRPLPARMADVVIVTNLPPNCSRQELRDKFEDIGYVKMAEMRDGGIGLVQFRDEIDAQRAVHLLDRSRMDSYTIGVKLY